MWIVFTKEENQHVPPATQARAGEGSGLKWLPTGAV